MARRDPTTLLAAALVTGTWIAVTRGLKRVAPATARAGREPSRDDASPSPGNTAFPAASSSVPSPSAPGEDPERPSEPAADPEPPPPLAMPAEPTASRPLLAALPLPHVPAAPRTPAPRVTAPPPLPRPSAPPLVPAPARPGPPRSATPPPAPGLPPAPATAGPRTTDRTRRLASRLLSLVAVVALLVAGFLAMGAARGDDIGDVDLAPDEVVAAATPPTLRPADPETPPVRGDDAPPPDAPGDHRPAAPPSPVDTPAPASPSPAPPSPMPAVAEAPTPAIDVEVRSARAADQQVAAAVAPVRLAVPALDLDVPVVMVGQDADGRMAVPADVDDAGWYRHGPAPGNPGNAVIAGHVDDRDQGLGAFHELVDLAVGDEVVVTADDGTTSTWEVTGRELIDKSALDVEALFRRTGPTQLVLVTCGGNFDRSRRSYRANVVVVATPVAP